MRILHICGYTVERGGTSKIAFDHANFQTQNSHQVSILSLNFKNEQCYPIPDKCNLLTLKPNFLSKFIPDFSSKAVSFLNRNSNKFDIIQIHGIWNWLSIAPFLSNSKAKKVITIHGMLSNWTLNHGKYKKIIFGALFQKKCLKSADALVVNTAKEKKELLEYLNIKDHKNLFIVPNSITPIKAIEYNEKLELLEYLKLSKDCPKILFLSRLHAKKGVRLLLEAFALLVNKKTQLILAGPDDGEMEELKSLATKFGISERVVFTGAVSGRNKEILISLADVFVLPSFSEGFPMAVLEAIEVGVPVIVSNETRIDEYIEKYQCGLVVNHDVRKIAQAIEMILFDKQLADKFVVNGKIMLKEEFSPDFIFQKNIDIYQNLLEC